MTDGLRTKPPAPPPDAELAWMRAEVERLSTPPLRPVGENWRVSRAAVRWAWARHVERCEALEGER